MGDLDGDGNEDVVLTQNIFAINPEMPRCDAGRGLWLRGDGTGKLTAVSGQESGIKVYGEQRVRHGYYQDVIRYRTNVRPLLQDLWDHAGLDDVLPATTTSTGVSAATGTSSVSSHLTDS